MTAEKRNRPLVWRVCKSLNYPTKASANTLRLLGDSINSHKQYLYICSNYNDYTYMYDVNTMLKI